MIDILLNEIDKEKEMNKLQEEYIKVKLNNDETGIIELSTKEYKAKFFVDKYKIVGASSKVIETYPLYGVLGLLEDTNNNYELYNMKKINSIYVELVEDFETGNLNNIRFYKYNRGL